LEEPRDVNRPGGRTAERAYGRLSFLGVVLDPVRNSTPMSDHPAEISGGAGPVAVWVIATDEEWQVARETFRLLETPRGASSFGSAADQSP
jgi:acetate kinase